MPGAIVAILVIAGVLLGALAVAGLYYSRTRTLSHRVGSFSCAMRPAGSSREWVAGVAQYGAGRLDWWRLFSLVPRPRRSWQRSELVVVDREELRDAMRQDLYLVRCHHLTEEIELVMSRDAYAGLRSWLEAAPPSQASVRGVL